MLEVEKTIKLLVNSNGQTPIYNCLLDINKSGSHLFHCYKQSNNTPYNSQENYLFRIGSITKTFTAVLILQLMEDGMLQLEDSFINTLTNKTTKKLFKNVLIHKGINLSEQITIKNLLEHRSGLKDYFSDDPTFMEDILVNPNKSWNWEIILENYFSKNLHLEGLSNPGEQFHYADTNYVLLALLIEDLKNASYHRVLEDKILNPLSLKDTFLEFYQTKEIKGSISYPYYSIHNLQYVNTSFDWGGGGLISSAHDVHKFQRAVFHGKLFKKPQTLDLMLNFNSSKSSKRNSIAHGLGVQKKEISGMDFIGHNSAYSGMAFYNIEKELSIIINLNQVLVPHKAELLLRKTIKELIDSDFKITSK